MTQPPDSEIMAGRVPPHNLSAEKSVLGAMMLEPEAVASATERLRAEDFYYQNNARIFAAMAGLFAKGQPVDFVTLTDVLEKEGVMEAVGGYDYITGISTFVPSSAHVGEYIKIVEERSVLRQLIRAMAAITEDCYATSKEVEQILSDAEKAIFSLSQSKHRQGFVPIREAVDRVLDQIQLLSEEGSAVTGLKTFSALDHWLTGLHPSELILVAARPGMGKTAFELNLAWRAAQCNADATIALFSLEMPFDQLTARLLSDAGNLPLAGLRTGQIEDFSKLWDAAGKLGQSSIYIDDTPGITVMEIRSKCRRLKMEKGLSLVGIDYLQLISGAGGGRASESRQQEVSEITRALKLMARELDVPVVLLSQLSRAPEKRDNHRPMLADLRESGAIEQDADVVIFLYREAYYADEKKDVDAAQLSNVAEVKIAKNRNGPTGTVKLTWDAASASYRDIDTRFEEPSYGG